MPSTCCSSPGISVHVDARTSKLDRPVDPPRRTRRLKSALFLWRDHASKVRQLELLWAGLASARALSTWRSACARRNAHKCGPTRHHCGAVWRTFERVCERRTAQLRPQERYRQLKLQNHLPATLTSPTPPSRGRRTWSSGARRMTRPPCSIPETSSPHAPIGRRVRRTMRRWRRDLRLPFAADVLRPSRGGRVALARTPRRLREGAIRIDLRAREAMCAPERCAAAASPA